MTKKHYELIAGALFEYRNTAPPGIHLGIALALRDRLRDDNPKFNSRKFLQACGINEDMSRVK